MNAPQIDFRSTAVDLAGQLQAANVSIVELVDALEHGVETITLLKKYMTPSQLVHAQLEIDAMAPKEAMAALATGLTERLERAERTLRAAGFIDFGAEQWLPPLGPRWLSAAHDVLAERRRQVEQKDWSADHDDAHEGGELAEAAMCYADPAAHCQLGIPHHWPWIGEWWKPRDRRHNLVRAGALIIAEIERLDRAKADLPTTEHESPKASEGLAT